jgi:hypothetical protein
VYDVVILPDHHSRTGNTIASFRVFQTTQVIYMPVDKFIDLRINPQLLWIRKGDFYSKFPFFCATFGWAHI